MTGLFPPPFFDIKNKLLRSWPFIFLVFWTTPFSNIAFTSFSIREASSLDIFTWWGGLVCQGSSRKSTFNPEIIPRISGLFVTFSQFFKRLFNLLASGKSSIEWFWNSLNTRGWTYFSLLIGTNSGLQIFPVKAFWIKGSIFWGIFLTKFSLIIPVVVIIPVFVVFLEVYPPNHHPPHPPRPILLREWAALRKGPSVVVYVGDVIIWRPLLWFVVYFLRPFSCLCRVPYMLPKSFPE